MIARKCRPCHIESSLLVIVGIVVALCPAVRADEFAAPLPEGVRAVWEPGKAHHETSPTRERICINGLWRWQPAGPDDKETPKKDWGFFKVPGCWPGITDYLQTDSQTLYRHPGWRDARLAGLTAAWYEREITVPSQWRGRRIAVSAQYLNSYATVYVDGKQVGEIRFPGGEVDLTTACRPGARHLLNMRVVALPLKAVLLSYSDTASARQVQGRVPRRGLCGDVYLESTPLEARVADLSVETSVRKQQIACDAALQGLAAGGRYSLRARIAHGGRDRTELTSKTFTANDLEHGRITFTGNWKPDRLWDLHTPGNMYSLSLSLHDAKGQVLDTSYDVRFGFREFWIDGRDFYLNGTRIFLSAVPLANAQIGAGPAGYEGARESLERLKSFGINCVYTHNYDCEPGSHLSFAEVLRAADDVGMLVSLTQPHFSHYEWQSPGADRDNGYQRHAEFYVRQAQNHPSVVFYSMSHNATGYEQDMNPDMIDGEHDPRETWSLNNVKLALRAEAIVRRLDPSRIVYHHASGNLGVMHTTNFYPNFAPIQELSDWFEHWGSAGKKPVFTCEYGAPFTWDWAMYRGWYKGERSFGSARVPWEFCLAEWNAQFLGDRAFQTSEMEKANLRWEAKQFRAGNLWHRWDYPYEIGSKLFDDRHAVIGMYLTDNLRALRTWGVSATSPWEYGHFWKLRDGVDQRRKALRVDWNGLQRPGFSPDVIEGPFERMDLAFERSDWIATADGQALVRNNQPLLAYIGGRRSRFTSKDHNFHAGETVDKQIIVVNNSRETVACDCDWSLGVPEAPGGRQRSSVTTGQQERIPVNFVLPAALAPGKYELQATVTFSTGHSQHDSFSIDVLPRRRDTSAGIRRDPVPAGASTRIALFDPKGETKKLLDAAGVAYVPVDASADLSAHETLILGKSALTLDGPVPRVGRVREGLKVIVFEQHPEFLEKRLGFRVHEYGLRQVYPRLVDHPLLAGIATEHLRDWRGEATILPPRLDYELRPRYGPTVKWCDIPVTRVWRCGNQGNVASVLIEKPARGNFLPITDGGFSLQYSPLLEYREGQGLVLFCQLDVTGRTEADPAAELLARNILQYVASWKPAPSRKVVYAGDPAGIRHLESAGISVDADTGANLSPGQVLVVGPGGGRKLAARAQAIAGWLQAGGSVLAIGLDEQDANAFLPFTIRMKKAEHISAYFDPFDARSPLAGVGPADVHNRDPRELPLITAGATVIGDGVLARAEGMDVVFCQLVPWQFDYNRKPNVKRTFRRASFLVSRLLANMGVESSTPILARLETPVAAAASEKRWSSGLYLDQPEEWDDPYRFFRW
jgi:beta-galactosidase